MDIPVCCGQNDRMSDHIHEHGRDLLNDIAPLTRENVAALMELFPVGDRFYQEFTLKQVLLTAQPSNVATVPVPSLYSKCSRSVPAVWFQVPV